LLACFSSSGRQWTIIAVSANRYQSVRTAGDRRRCLVAPRGGAISTERSRLWIGAASLRIYERGPASRRWQQARPFSLRHQAEVEMTTLHDFAAPNIESSPHSPCCDQTVTRGDERNQLCSRWRRSTKGEPCYDLGRMAASDTRRPIGGHRRESSFTAAGVASHPFSCP
jgi:hypothetical protein